MIASFDDEEYDGQGGWSDNTHERNRSAETSEEEDEAALAHCDWRNNSRRPGMHGG